MSSPIRSSGRGHKRRASERSITADHLAESSASGSRRDAIAKGRQARNSLADIFDDEQDAEGEEDDLAPPPHVTEAGNDATSPKRKRTIRLTTRPRKSTPSAETPRPPTFSEEPEETPEAKQAAQVEKEEAEMQTRWMEEHFEIVEQLPLEIHRMFALIGELEGQTHARLKSVSQNTIKYRDARIALNKVLQSSAKKSTENTDGISDVQDVDGATPPTDHAQRKDLLRTISHAADECVKGAEEKMDLAITAYNLIDRHIRRLDGDISKMEASILLGLRSGTEESRGVRDALGLPNDVGEEEIVEAVDPNSKLGRKGMSTQAETASLTKSAGAARNRNSRASTSATANKSRSRAGTVTTETPKEPSIVSGMAYDPTEPTYCYCDQVSVDEMVACENDDCKLEWFHYACVGLTSAPKGKWFCRFCAPPTWKGPGMAVPPNAKFKPPGWKKGGIKS